MARLRHGGRRGPAPFERGHKRGATRLAAFFALALAFVATPFILSRSIIYLQPAQGLALLGLLAVAILVALPLGNRAVNTRLIVWCLAFYLGFDILWADYVAIDLPFIPFVTPVRLYLFALVGVWLFLAATSRPVHERTWKSLKTIPILTFSLLTLILFEGLSIIFSVDPNTSQKNFLYHLMSYAVPFLVAAGFVRSRGDVEIVVRTLAYCAGVVGLIAVAETIVHRNLYGGFFGKWLNYDAAWLQGVWFGDFRDGKYRAFGPFLIHLSLAEFFILSMPFVLYCLEKAKRVWVKLVFWASLGLCLFGVYATDSRTSLISALCIIAAYLVFKGLRYQIERKESPLRPLIALVILGLVVIAPIAIGLVFRKIGWENAFGESGSRTMQLVIGIPKVAHRPVFGYGVGNSGFVLNFKPDGHTPTIDNYYLSVALDAGIPAMLAFALLPLTMMWIGFRRAARKDPDAPMFLAFALAGLGFALVRLTLSQYENINFFYILLGTFVALVLLVREEQAAAAPAPAADKGRRRRRIVGDERWLGQRGFLSSLRGP